MKIGVIGAGRIGKVHIRNISLFVPELTIKTVADPFMNEKTAAYVKQFGIENVTKEADDILNDPEIEAVVIASSTNTHAKFIIESAKAGKNIFCEKPIDYDLNRVHEAIQAAKDAGVQLQIGFCRRFDHNHRAVYDMMIHDFDMARFLAGDEVEEVYAQGSVLVDPEIGKAGDVDTAVVTLKFKSGTIATIDNSRRAVYGYDQRVEVFGSKGVAFNGNDIPNTAHFADANGTVGGTAYQVMWDRYEQAFVNEMNAFAKAIKEGTETPVTGEDGLYPVEMAAAATKSLKDGRPVKIAEVR